MLQNIIGVIDSSGKIVVEYKYDAFGVPSTTTRSAIADINHFMYKGYYYDAESGFYYLKSRYYDPVVGRFISPDSIDYINPQDVYGMNLFTYCNNNPVMYLDGDGNFAISTLAICAIIGACIGFGTAAYVDSKDGQMFNGDVKWYDYLGATALGGLAGAGIGYALPSLSTFASSSFSISSGLLMSGEGAALSIGIAITGVQVLEGIGALGLIVMMASDKWHGKPNSYFDDGSHVFFYNKNGNLVARHDYKGKSHFGYRSSIWTQKDIHFLMKAI